MRSLEQCQKVNITACIHTYVGTKIRSGRPSILFTTDIDLTISSHLSSECRIFPIFESGRWLLLTTLRPYFFLGSSDTELFGLR